MFAPRYFAPRYFPATYWPVGSDVAPADPVTPDANIVLVHADNAIVLVAVDPVDVVVH